MRVWLLAMVSVFLLTACATSPVPVEQAAPIPQARLFGLQERPSESYGTMQVTRDSGATGSACNVRLRVDGVKVAEFAPGETGTFYLVPGEHVLGVITGVGLCPNRLKENAAVIVEGETKRYRISIDGNGALDIARTAT